MVSGFSGSKKWNQSKFWFHFGSTLVPQKTAGGASNTSAWNQWNQNLPMFYV